MSSKWEKLRSDFPITKRCLYLDHAAGGIISDPVFRKTQEHLNELREEGDFAWMKWMERREQIRGKVARWIHAAPEEIGFITSTSHGMNLIAELLASEGDVLTHECEFPSSTLPWVWRDTKIFFQKTLNHRAEWTQDNLERNSVKTLLTSYVQYATGYRQDLKKIGQMKGDRYFVVNASQAFGAFPLDVQESQIDFLCSNSYKWMMAGYGGGILYIRKKWLERFCPQSVGWRSVLNPDCMDNQKAELRNEASRYEMGCPSFAAIFALGAAVDYLSDIGIESIAQRILSLSQYATKQLEAAGFEVVSFKEEEHRSGIVIVKVKEAQAMWKKLIQNKIFVSPRGAGIRLAPHFYNTFEEIDLCVKQMRKLLK